MEYDDQVVHHLRLKYCRILNKHQLTNLGDRFEMNSGEQFAQSSANENIIIYKKEQYGGNLELIFQDLQSDDKEAKIVPRSFRFFQLSSQCSQSKNSNMRYYFYCQGLQLLPLQTLQDYEFQDSDCIEYAAFPIEKQNQNIQLIIEIDKTYQLEQVDPLSQILDLQELLCKQQNKKPSDNYYIFLQTQRLDPQKTYQQMTIKDGYMLKFAQLHKPTEKVEDYFEICIKQPNGVIHIQVPQEWTPIQVMKYFFNADNNLYYHGKQLDQQFRLNQQGVANGDMFELQFPEKLEVQFHPFEYVKSNFQVISKENTQKLDEPQENLLTFQEKQEEKPIYYKKEFMELKATSSKTDFKTISKPGLVAQFRCREQGCLTKGSRQYLSLGFGNFDLTYLLKLKCRCCNNEHNLEEVKYFGWNTKFKLFDNNIEIDKGIISNQLQEICKGQLNNHTLIIEKLD